MKNPSWWRRNSASLRCLYAIKLLSRAVIRKQLTRACHMYRCCDAWGVFYITNGRNGRVHECRKGKTPSAPRKVQQPGLAPPREERWWCFAKIKKEVGPVPFLILPCHALSWTLKAKKNYLENRIKDQINIPRPTHRNVCYCYNESPHLGVGRLGQQNTSR